MNGLAAPRRAAETREPAMPFAADDSDDRRLQRRAAATVATLLVLQVAAASRLELMFDEAYYRLWVDHLNWGYYDHPPLVAVWIKASMALFGTSELGIRLLGILATALGAVSIYVIAQDLFAVRLKSAFAALLWTATPLLNVGAILVTPDTPLTVGWTTALWALARLYRTGDWHWWLVVGGAAGVALEAKYTALFLGPGIVLAMVVLPGWRHWWRHPAPYLGGAIALALFAPNILWNARNGWQTFAKQFGRVADTEWTWRYVAEFLGSQLGLLNPLTCVLACGGLWLAARSSNGDLRDARRLLACLVAPLLIYFLTHSLHDRVQGNWMAPLYPALILLAADAGLSTAETTGRLKQWLDFSRHWAWALGIGMTALVYVQALLTPLPLKPQSDPTSLLSGWRTLASDLDAIATREGARTILTSNYALNSLLTHYAPGGRPILQINERRRWTYASATSVDPPPPYLFIVEARRLGGPTPLAKFADTGEIARIDRTRRGTVLETYVVFRADRPQGPVLDPIADSRR